MSSEQKAVEARLSVEVGADGMDMVIHIGAALANEWEADVRAVRQAIPDAVLKAIIETCFLTDEQKREATAAVVRAGAEFVKTSTGFGMGGATLDDVRPMPDVIAGLEAQERVPLGAAGSVCTPDDAQAMIAAGVSLLGMSGGEAMVTGYNLPIRSSRVLPDICVMLMLQSAPRTARRGPPTLTG